MDLTANIVGALLDAVPDDPRPVYARDRAVVCLRAAGVSSATVAALRREEVRLERDALHLARPGQELLIPFAPARGACPGRQLWSWLQAGHIAEGPCFRSVKGKAHVQQAGLTTSAVRQILWRYYQKSKAQTFPVSSERDSIVHFGGDPA